MKALYTFLALAFLSQVLLSQEKQTRNLSNFDAISVTSSGNVYVKQGSTFQVVVEAKSKDLEKIETEVRKGRLVISTQSSRWFSWGSTVNDFNVYVTLPELNGVTVSGSGSINGQSVFESDGFTGSVSGSGRINLELIAENISSSISGSGRINLFGQAQDVKLSISGSGRFNAEDMKAQNYNISISGSGNSTISVEKQLDVRIAGSGNVRYYGDQVSVQSSIAGSGNVRKVN